MNEKQIAPGLTSAGQPTPEDIETYRAQGVRTIVNLRSDDESPAVAAEERRVEDAGITYAQIPISPATLDDLSVQRFSQALSGVDALPAIVHCAGGGRAGVMSLLHLSITHGWSLSQTLEEGDKLGIAPQSDSPYRAFFESYIQRHSPAER
jgi:uncharacterized protein (TIGR01244 family)